MKLCGGMVLVKFMICVLEVVFFLLWFEVIVVILEDMMVVEFVVVEVGDFW